VSCLTALTSLELWGCSKATDEGMRAVFNTQRHWAHVQQAQQTEAGWCTEAGTSPGQACKYVPELQRGALGSRGLR
jgi:hypothetical protein